MTAISSCIVFVLLFMMPSLLYSNIYQGVNVEGIELSGCSQEKATELLMTWQEERRNKIITFVLGDMNFKLAATSIDFDIDVHGALTTAWSYGRDGSWWQRIKKIKAAKEQGYCISVDSRYNEVKLNHLIEEWQRQIERPARNATISIITGGVIPEELGYRLEVDALRTLVLQSFINTEDLVVDLPVEILYPEVTTAELVRTEIHEPLSMYTTTFNCQDVNRVTNITLAASKTNGHIIYPGEIFSFNDIVGPREKSYGFKEAIEIVDGEFVPGVGGGICQLSSTLYNAVILANLDIVERYNHSKTLSYVPIGRDATVVFGMLDFKFINNTTWPLMIIAEVNEDQLMVGIFGRSPLAEKVEIITKNQKKISPGIRKEDDNSLYAGETKLEKEGKPGVSITVIRSVQVKGQIIKQEILSTDCYPAEDALLKVGRKIPPFVNKVQ